MFGSGNGNKRKEAANAALGEMWIMGEPEPLFDKLQESQLTQDLFIISVEEI